MEIWVPYGDVESLVTLMQENLGETIDPKPESHVDEIVIPLAERMKGAGQVFICDHKPATLKVVKALLAKVPREGVKFISSSPRKVEAAVPDLKEAVDKLRPPGESEPSSGAQGGKVSQDIAGPGRKFAISTGEPDPLFGFIDAPIALALGCIAGARRLAYKKRDGDSPQIGRAHV